MAITSINNGTIQVGVDLDVGGAIGELKFIAGSNYIDTDDAGRYVQFSAYDGNALYTSAVTGPWGWNPVQGGDVYNHHSPVITSTVTSSSIYTKTQPYEWYPDDKGGGSGTPVLTECYFEQTITFLAGQTKVVRVLERVSYFGATSRPNVVWEAPVGYLTTNYLKLARYSGTAPWTGAALTIDDPTGTNIYTPELWAALVDTGNDGVTFYTPGHFPYVAAAVFSGDAANIRPVLYQSIAQNQNRDFVYYLIPGDVAQARTIISQIRAHYEQEGFRFRNDDGSEVTATWLDSQDASINRDKNINTRLRMLVNASNDPVSTAFQLEYRRNGGAWTKVSTT